MTEIKERGMFATGALRVGDVAAATILLPALIPLGFLTALADRDGRVGIVGFAILAGPLAIMSLAALGFAYQEIFGIIEDNPTEAGAISATAAAWMLGRYVSSRSKNYQEVWF